MHVSVLIVNACDLGGGGSGVRDEILLLAVAINLTQLSLSLPRKILPLVLSFTIVVLYYADAGEVAASSEDKSFHFPCNIAEQKQEGQDRDHLTARRRV